MVQLLSAKHGSKDLQHVDGAKMCQVAAVPRLIQEFAQRMVASMEVRDLSCMSGEGIQHYTVQ